MAGNTHLGSWDDDPSLIGDETLITFGPLLGVVKPDNSATEGEAAKDHPAVMDQGADEEAYECYARIARKAPPRAEPGPADTDEATDANAPEPDEVVIQRFLRLRLPGMTTREQIVRELKHRR